MDETRETGSSSFRPVPTISSCGSSCPVVTSRHPPSIEALNSAIARTSISGEQEPKRSVPDFLKPLIDRLRRDLNTPVPPPKRVRRIVKNVFQCGHHHFTCMSCYERHSKKCRYCCTTNGSVVKLEIERAKEWTNNYACHEGRGFVLPNENEIFCPDDSCQFCGPLDSVLDHVKDVHSVPIQHFSYGDVMRIPLHMVGKYLVLRAEDNAIFVLWSVENKTRMRLSVICAKQPICCESNFTFDVTHDLSPGEICWYNGNTYISNDPTVAVFNPLGTSIVMYGNKADVRTISGAKSRIKQSCILNSNLGDMEIDSQNSVLSVPMACKRGGKWYGDLFLSIFALSDATKSPASE